MIDGVLATSRTKYGADSDRHANAVVTDGGQLLDGKETDDASRPEDCDCLPTFDTHSLGCWPCYRDGFETANPNTTDEAGED